jgi:hypothetical protein
MICLNARGSPEEEVFASRRTHGCCASERCTVSWWYRGVGAVVVCEWEQRGVRDQRVGAVGDAAGL